MFDARQNALDELREAIQNARQIMAGALRNTPAASRLAFELTPAYKVSYDLQASARHLLFATIDLNNAVRAVTGGSARTWDELEAEVLAARGPDAVARLNDDRRLYEQKYT